MILLLLNRKWAPPAKKKWENVMILCKVPYIYIWMIWLKDEQAHEGGLKSGGLEQQVALCYMSELYVI